MNWRNENGGLKRFLRIEPEIFNALLLRREQMKCLKRMDLWKLSLNDSVNGTVGAFKKKNKKQQVHFSEWWVYPSKF